MALAVVNDVSTWIEQITEGALFTLREMNYLAPTVLQFRDTNSMQSRRVSQYGTVSMSKVAEGADLSPVGTLDRTLLSTLTPDRYGSSFLMTDERMSTDPENYRDDLIMEMGMSFATNIDLQIAGLFGSLTGGTVGAYGGTLGWSNILQAVTLMRQKNIPPPYWCVIGAGQYYHLANNGGTIETAFTRSQEFNTRLTTAAMPVMQSPVVGGVNFIITNNIQGNAGTAGLGALYAPQAMAFDVRTPLTFEVQRDASRSAWEIVAQMRYAYGTWRPLWGLQLRGTDVIPTT